MGVFQEPQQFFYKYGGYYTELIYAVGAKVRGLDNIHIFYVQGVKTFVIDSFKVPRDRFRPEIPTVYWSPTTMQNTIECYRSYMGKLDIHQLEKDKMTVESMGVPVPYHATFGPGGFYLNQRAHFAGFFMNSLTVEIKTTHSTFTFYLHKNSVTFNNVTIQLEANLYTDETFDQIGSVTLVNAGEALVIVYNVPHRFYYMAMFDSLFAKSVAQFNVKWDGPITHMILSDAFSLERTFDDPMKITLLSHVEIDNELLSTSLIN
ncbi:unnamed protein product [Litomosoides sigmodontis]|uniref:Uncharacterized protein n=1 Tax=Litomosoides sigmodontis TaxID=42156 RepID=A0A3P7M584_LITSI|nr:unnamed protein product [Litomosoides sigmodontis]